MIKLTKNPILIELDPQGFEVFNFSARRSIVLNEETDEKTFIESFKQLVKNLDQDSFELIITRKAQERNKFLNLASIKLDKPAIMIESDPRGFEIFNLENRRSIVLEVNNFTGSAFKYEDGYLETFLKLFPNSEELEFIVSPKAQKKINVLIEFNRIDS